MIGREPTCCSRRCGPPTGAGMTTPRRPLRVHNVGRAMADTAIVGREAELMAIGAFVAEGRRGPAALVFAGEAGIGKTTLWRTALCEVEVDAGAVLVCRGIEAEASLSFVGLSELLGPVLDDVLPSLALPRRRALEVALLLAPSREVTPDQLAVGLAVLDVLKLMSACGPVVVAVDDLQWLDPASANAVQIAFRRLVDEAVVVLATVREVPGVRLPIDLERCFVGDQLTRVELGPVGSAALLQLLRDRLGVDLSRPELLRVSEATGGNPFFALEVGRELARSGSRPSSGAPLQVPESLLALLGDRLGRLPTDTGDVLLQAAAAARPTVELLAASYGDLDRVVAALDVAAGEGLVQVDGSRVVFSHPLYASICYQQAPAGKRRAAHRALADAATDVEERARHLAHAVDGADTAVAAVLDDAAEQAARRGAPAAGAELFELSADLTAQDLVLARQRRLRAARLYRIAGDRVRASTTLEELLIALPPGPERADVLLELAATRRVDALATIALCEEALAIEALDEVRVARVLAYRSFARMFAGEVVLSLHDARAALEIADRVDDPVLLAAAITRVGQAETYSAEITPGLLEHGADIENRLDLALEYYESPGGALAWRQMRLGEVDRARELLQRLTARAVARGDESSRAQLLWSLAMAAWLAGQLVEALDHANEASELSEQTHASFAPGMSGRVKGLIEVDAGLAEEARTSAEVALAMAEDLHDPYSAIAGAGVLGRLELASGNIAAAGTHLRDLPGRLIAMGINDPALCVWEDSIEVLISLGELELARAVSGALRRGGPPTGEPMGDHGLSPVSWSAGRRGG